MPQRSGNFQGGIVSTNIKSGTNELHGVVYEFLRNDALNANSWSNNWQGADKPGMRWNMFGATAGGPIVKNKLFFFGDYQGLRFNTPASTGRFTVFTADERRGDFSRLLTGKGIQLYNPFQLDANGNRVPFPNNQIPLSLIDPVAKNLFSSTLYPAPTNSLLQNNQVNTSSSNQLGDQFDVKIDANLAGLGTFRHKPSLASEQEVPGKHSTGDRLGHNARGGLVQFLGLNERAKHHAKDGCHQRQSVSGPFHTRLTIFP